MNHFLRILLLVLLALLAIKLLPLTFAIGCALGFALVVLAVLGVSILSIMICVALGLAVVLSPIWLPVLLLLGLIALLKRSSRPDEPARISG